MSSTEVPMPEMEKQHLGMVDVNLGTQQVTPHSNGYPVQPGYPAQQNNVPTEAPPSYSQTTNYTVPVVSTAPRLNYVDARAPRQLSQSVPDYSRLALFVTLCCCLPFGLAGYFMSSQAKDRELRGDNEGARSMACCSLGWSIAGIVCGIILVIVLSVYYIYLPGVYL